MTQLYRILPLVLSLLAFVNVGFAQTFSPWQPYRAGQRINFVHTDTINTDSLFIRGGVPNKVVKTIYRSVKFDSVVRPNFFKAVRHFGMTNTCSPDTNFNAFPEYNTLHQNSSVSNSSTLVGSEIEKVGAHIWRLKMNDKIDYFFDTDTLASKTKYQFRMPNGTFVTVVSHDSITNEFVLGRVQPIKTFTVLGQYGLKIKLSENNGIVQIGHPSVYTFDATDQTLTPLTQGEFYNYNINDTIQEINEYFGPSMNNTTLIDKRVSAISTIGNIKTITWTGTNYSKLTACNTCPFISNNTFTYQEAIKTDSIIHNWPLDTSLGDANSPKPWISFAKYGMLANLRALEYYSTSTDYYNFNPDCYNATNIDAELPTPRYSLVMDPVRNVSRQIGTWNLGTIYANFNGVRLGKRFNGTLVNLDQPLHSYSKLSLTPNPAKSIFQLREAGEVLQDAEYRILDLTGKVAKQGVTDPMGNVSIADLPSGIYQLVSKRQTVRLAVQ